MANINKIIDLAKEKGISNAFICSKLGLGRGYLNDVKNGKAIISDERLKIIAEILGTTPEYLKDETNEIEKPSPAADEDLQDVVILCRDGNNKKIQLSREQMDMIEKMLNAIEPDYDDRL